MSIIKNNFPFYRQRESKDCGPTCLKIVAKYYGKSVIIQDLRNLTETTRTGSTLLGLSDAAESIGFRSIGISTNSQKVN